MKSFKAYLTESHRTFDFRIRLACELPDDLLGKIKTVLEAYKLDSITKPKRLPIQESPDFPGLGPVEVHLMDATFHYPCNDEQVRTLIAERAGINLSCIKVTPKNSPFEAARDGTEQSNKGGKVVLTTEEMSTEAAPADLVGDARVPSLIKELEETRKYQYEAPQGGTTPQAKTTNELPVGKTSPLGGHKPKLPPVGRGRR